MLLLDCWVFDVCTSDTGFADLRFAAVEAVASFVLRFCISSNSRRRFLALRVSYTTSDSLGPRIPRTPPSSNDSRIALSSMASSCSHPPLGKIHSALREAETNKILPPSTMGTQPVTRRYFLFLVASICQRCVSRPLRDSLRAVTFWLMRSDCWFDILDGVDGALFGNAWPVTVTEALLPAEAALTMSAAPWDVFVVAVAVAAGAGGFIEAVAAGAGAYAPCAAP
mmetsp:Transcript_567/g.1380  ORF Transcript_567/g.1380 Transcript_567/m.1380 type:complete len:225 (+) Transcript_567:629-1303(+)